MFSVSAGRRVGCVHLATPSGISNLTSIFQFWVCDLTSLTQRDIEPAVHFPLATVAFREFGSGGGTVVGKVIL
jgi:hypothetical protein